MSVKIIHALPDGIWIDDRSRPIVILPMGLFKSIRDGALCVDVTIEDLAKAADEAKEKKLNNGTPMSTSHGTVNVNWPSLGLIKNHPDFKEYKILRPTKGTPPAAVPCTVLMEVGKRRKHRFDLHYRTMTACKVSWNLTTARFESIVARKPGYRSLLPPGVVGIKTHPPGWTPPGGAPLLTTLGNPGPLWECWVLKGGRIRAAVINGSPQTFSDPNSVPMGILNHCRWR